MRRMLVIGSPGAGKSTFARELARQTGLPLTHLDEVYWQPGWVKPDRETWEAKLRALLAQDRWILDGNYARTLEERAARADHAIFLLYPRWLCLTRAVYRDLLHRRPDGRWLGWHPPNREFLAFIWRFPRLAERQLAQLRAFPQLTVVVLRSDREAERFLRLLGDSA